VAKHISNLALANFRSFGSHVEIPMRKITLLYGQNSAGKSSILKSLLLLKQSFESGLRSGRAGSRSMIFSGEHVDLGSYRTTVSGHDLSRQVSVGVTMKSAPRSPSDEEPAQGDSVTWTMGESPDELSLDLGLKGRRLRFYRWKADSRSRWLLDRSSIDALLELLNPHETLLAQDDWVISTLNMGGGIVPVFSGNLFPRSLDGLVAVTGDRNAQPPPGVDIIKNRGSSHNDDSIPTYRMDWASESWMTLHQEMFSSLRDTFESLTHIGPLRREPQRFERYVPTEDQVVGASGAQMLSHMFERPSLVTQVNNYLGSMQLPYRIRVKPLGSQETVGAVVYLTLVNQATGLEVSPSDVGVGYSQVLPLIAQSVLSRGSIVCVEQPELHLHPAMQARLGDMFIDQALGGNNVQFIIETHSESLMLRILRRIRERRLTPEDVQVVYVDQAEGGDSVVHDLLIHESGEFLTEWPRGFFDERLEEI